MNTNEEDEEPLPPFRPDMLLAGAPFPYPLGTEPAPAPREARKSEMHLTGTALAVWAVLVGGRSVESVAQGIRRPVSDVQDAFRHLADALRVSAAAPSMPYSRPSGQGAAPAGAAHESARATAHAPTLI